MFKPKITALEGWFSEILANPASLFEDRLIEVKAQTLDLGNFRVRRRTNALQRMGYCTSRAAEARDKSRLCASPVSSNS